jgi:hypothetical protein
MNAVPAAAEIEIARRSEIGANGEQVYIIKKSSPARLRGRSLENRSIVLLHG